ncbi:MAG: DUF7483 domain-containing protein [Acidimicrobiia bacterium]
MIALFVAWYATPAPLALFVDAAPVDGNTFSTAASFAGSGMRLATGSYAGNGADNRQITAIGFQPDVVIIKGDTTQVTVMKTSTMTGDSAKALVGPTAPGANQIQSLDADGFTLGTNATVNASGITYYWSAFKTFAGELKIGSYTGNGTSQSLTSLGFSPEYVIVLSAAASEAVQRSAPMSTTFFFDGDAGATNRITSLDADGFSVGDSSRVNTSGTTYYYVAWNAVSGRMTANSYTGNGVDNMNVTGVGFQPEYVINRANGATRGVHRPASISGTSSQEFMARANFTTGIKALLTDGFQVGTSSTVNTNGTTYYYVAFRGAS